MPSTREQIRTLVLSGDPFDQPAEDLRELQLEAAREAFAAHRERIPLLRTRAQECGVHEITGLDDLVPLLFSHTSYKSYPVSLITSGRWDRLLRWYTTVSAVEPGDVDVEGVRDVDEWTDRITAAAVRLRQSGADGSAGHQALRRTRRRRQDHLRRDTRLLCAGDDPRMRPTTTAVSPVAVAHVVRGEVDTGPHTPHDRPDAVFTAPALDLDRLVWPRTEPGPAFHVPVAEIVDLLVETGEALRADREGLLAEALDRMVWVSPLPGEVLERAYAVLWRSFQRPGLYAQIDHELGGADVLDGWREVRLPEGRTAATRAFPPRLVHIIAGNAPGVAAMSVVRGALTKGVNLLKLPSNDLFTATAILRTMAGVAPGHPVVRSFSAVYWRGGDEAVESVLFRPQFFDKLVAWGGEATIRGALRYVGPGFELVSFDPKTSISLIGREAFDSRESLARAADAGAADATFFNQQACVASRFQFVEGTEEDTDRYAALLCERLGTAREFSSAGGPRIAGELREEIDVLRSLAPEYRVWGGYEGRGLVIRSPEPVDFHPDGKIVNVVPVAGLSEAVRHAGVATQTAGVYPDARKAELRDALACAGVQRVVSLGGAGGMPPGLSHDGFYPLQRLMRWVNDE